MNTVSATNSPRFKKCRVHLETVRYLPMTMTRKLCSAFTREVNCQSFRCTFDLANPHSEKFLQIIASDDLLVRTISYLKDRMESREML